MAAVEPTGTPVAFDTLRVPDLAPTVAFLEGVAGMKKLATYTAPFTGVLMGFDSGATTYRVLLIKHQGFDDLDKSLQKARDALAFVKGPIPYTMPDGTVVMHFGFALDGNGLKWALLPAQFGAADPAFAAGKVQNTSVHSVLRVLDMERFSSIMHECFGFTALATADFPTYTQTFYRGAGMHNVELTYNKNRTTPYEHGDPDFDLRAHDSIGMVVPDLASARERLAALTPKFQSLVLSDTATVKADASSEPGPFGFTYFYITDALESHRFRVLQWL